MYVVPTAVGSFRVRRVDSCLIVSCTSCQQLSNGLVCYRPFLNAGKRELLSDYALPVAVLVMSFVGSYIFRKVDRKSLLPVHIEIAHDVVVALKVTDVNTTFCIGLHVNSACLVVDLYADEQIIEKT